MNKWERFLVSIKNRYFGWLKRDPDPNTIDRTGLVRSNHPVPVNGWIKGWVVDTPNRNIIVVCKHAGPSSSPPNNKIYVVDTQGVTHERTIINVNKSSYKLDGKSEKITLRGEDNYFVGGDIAICKVDEPFPDTVKAYKFSTDPKVLQKTSYTFNQNGYLTSSRIFYSEDLAWIFARNRFDGEFIGGDSGTTWFVWEDKEWKVLTHTTKGMAGEGPYYGHKYVYPQIEKNISEL